MIASAWWAARLAREDPKKPLPSLADLLLRGGEKKQTVPQQKAALQMISEQIGVPLRKRKKKTKGKAAR